MSRVVVESDVDDISASKQSRFPADFTEQQRAWVRDIAAKIKQQRQDAKLQSPAKRPAT
jgi:hypothetical protein